jgi:predicted metalloprotease with PDZ domain
MTIHATKHSLRVSAALLIAAALPLAHPALAQRSAPVAAPVVKGVPDAVDTPYPGGVITLDIDASDIQRALYKVTETVPVTAGARSLILQLPQWIPGHHSPAGTIDQLVDVKFYVDGKLIPWKRDPVEVYAFHLDLPEGTKAVVAKFIHTSPLQGSEGRISVTQEMLNLQWDRMSLYPAGHYTRQIMVKPTVTFPEGWDVATALDGKTVSGAKVSWAPIDYEALVDSPIFAGKFFKRFDLGRGVAMNVVADKPEYLAIKPENLAAYKALVDEAYALHGVQHFDHYDFLLALTDRMGGIGLEHHRSSENAQLPRSWIDWKEMDWDRNVVAHEYDHSWDGKFRRPATIWTPDFREPMRDNLLWVYEGQNQFWGYVLAARSGVQSKEIVLGQFASNAGQFTQWPGRDWRSVEDTTHDPIIASRRPKPYASLDRNEDYYTEGALVWLEADQIIREGTHGAKGLDDFAKAFFGIKPGDWGQVGYDFAEVARVLNGVYPYDWAKFLDTRINQPGQPAPVAGIEKAGYKLVWKDTPNAYDKGRFGSAKVLSLAHSIGVVVDKEGRIVSTRWDSAAFNAALVTGTKILAVNGAAYSEDALKAAITEAKGTVKPITLITQRGDRVQTVSLDYHDGLRYPWLEKAGDAKAVAGLDALLAPRRAGAK